MTGVQIHDHRICQLGEGPLWHPARGALFWFDILERRLLTQGHVWQFDEHVSAAGWIDETTLLIASETRLFTLNLDTDARETLCPLEADNPVTRSNDGRADPWGGFWIGTMGKAAEQGAGAIYRYYRGELRQLYSPITISNAICFAQDGSCAYFTDTPTQCILRVALSERDGWPDGEPERWLDLAPDNWRPDGAVVDAGGNFWNAQWGGFRVACYAPDATFLRAVGFPAAQTTCPAFGGDDLTTLYCTSAARGLSANHAAQHPHSGKTFAALGTAQGKPEYRIIL